MAKLKKIDRIKEFLERKNIATMDDLKEILSTEIGMTVYRALKKLSYLSSYSHNGKYYTLKRIVKFNENGLWFYRSIGFSKYGTLMKTLEKLVSDSENGFFAQKLEKLLDVGVKESLLRLFQ